MTEQQWKDYQETVDIGFERIMRWYVDYSDDATFALAMCRWFGCSADLYESYCEEV